MSDDFCGLQRFGPLVFDHLVVDVARRRDQAVLVENRANVFGRVAEITGEFDFFVAGGGDFGDGAFEIGFHGTAHGVELEADAIDLVCWVFRICFGKHWFKRNRGPGGFDSGGKSCGKRTADKCASIHALHFTSSRGKGNRGSAEKGRSD